MELMGAEPLRTGLTATLFIVGIVALSPALRHFKRATRPMIRLDAMQVPTFRVTLYGGSLFRASNSAVPFLLPLMFRGRFWHERVPFGPAGAGGFRWQSHH